MKAFDKVKHEDLMKILERLEIDGKDLRIIKNLYWNQKVVVKIDDVLREMFDKVVRCHQIFQSI